MAVAPTERAIRIRLREQRLELLEGERVLDAWPVSTASRGAGERDGSEQTPRGLHRVCAKIGAGAPRGAVFVAREATGERYSDALAAEAPDRDWILTRILWLDGLEPERNRGGDVDTRRRFIYIHGAPDAAPMGVPGSHGCIRMRNEDVEALFDAVEEGALVEIVE